MLPGDGAVEDARRAAGRFAVGVEAVRSFGGGHINETFLAATAAGDLVVQRLNLSVFPDPVAVTANIVAVHRHLAGACMPEPVPALDGGWLLRDGSGVWRAWRRVPGAAPVGLSTPGVARAAGRLLGEFHHRLAGLDPAALTETLPGFHDPGRRLAALRAAVATDPLRRAAGVAAEIARAEAGAPLVILAADLSARVRRRVCHYDAKLDNVLFAGATAVCLVDFDTVMPGAWFWDVGDLLRSAASTAAEDDPDPRRAVADPALYRAVLDGYHEAQEGRPDGPTPAEREAVGYAGALVTYEQAVRFLTDWIEGDVYYRTSRPEQNLDRARAQFRLLASMPLSRIG
jgi:Ser/Thr protein kinase RdoA (MazF antagonist)